MCGRGVDSIENAVKHIVELVFDHKSCGCNYQMDGVHCKALKFHLQLATRSGQRKKKKLKIRDNLR